MLRKIAVMIIILLQNKIWCIDKKHFDGLVVDCGNSSASALGLPQSCTKPSTYGVKTATVVQACNTREVKKKPSLQKIH